MDKLHKRKLEKLFKKVEKLAQKGLSNESKYYDYINELISNGDYGSFIEMMFHYYEIDISDLDIPVVKKTTWKKILFKTTNSFLKNLSILYNKRGVYQNSFDILLSSSNNIIGQIREIDAFTNNAKYLIKNKEYSRITRETRYLLEVDKMGDVSYITYDDPKLSFDQNLLNRYSMALDILLS